MHDDTNIRTLRGNDNLQLVKTDGDTPQGDAERRIGNREDGPHMRLELVPEDVQVDDLEPTVRELPIDAQVVGYRNEVALLRQEHKDLDPCRIRI
jgi:hypothetical protein